jgi:hypothetical protein
MYQLASTVLPLLFGYRIVVITGSLAVKAWLQLLIGFLRTRGRMEDIAAAAELQEFYDQITVNDLDLVVCGNCKHFDAESNSMMPDQIGDHNRTNRVSRSCTYSDGKTTFDLIYHNRSIWYYVFESMNILSPATLLLHYRDVISTLMTGTIKHDQAKLKIEALEKIVGVMENLDLPLFQSVPEFSHPRYERIDSPTGDLTVGLPAARRLFSSPSPSPIKPIRCALQFSFDEDGSFGEYDEGEDVFGGHTEEGVFDFEDLEFAAPATIAPASAAPFVPHHLRC